MDISVVFVMLLWATASTCQEIAIHPKNATVLEGDDHQLQCQFKQIVHKCSWLHISNSPISINERYHYLDAIAKGENTTNCTIVITKFNSNDTKDWQCSYTVTDKKNGEAIAKSHKVYLTLEKRANLTTASGSTTDEPDETSEQGDNFLGLGLTRTYTIIAFAGGVSFLVLVITVSIICSQRKIGKSMSELLTSLVTCRAINRSYKDSVIDVITPVQNVSQPAASNRCFVEEVNETEPVYDYPEIFQFRQQLQGMKRQPKGPEALKSPKSKCHKYVNVDNDDPGEDSDCHYLTPRQYDPGEDTDDNLEEQHPEEPFYESPYHEISADEISARSPRKPVSPQQRIIQELQQHFQNLDKKSLQSTTVSKASPSCHCMKKCHRKPCKVPSNAVDNGKDHWPKKKFPKKRYENIPD